jgi:hypothetical protein
MKQLFIDEKLLFFNIHKGFHEGGFEDSVMLMTKF